MVLSPGLFFRRSCCHDRRKCQPALWKTLGGLSQTGRHSDCHLRRVISTPGGARLLGDPACGAGCADRAGEGGLELVALCFQIIDDERTFLCPFPLLPSSTVRFGITSAAMFSKRLSLGCVRQICGVGCLGKDNFVTCYISEYQSDWS